LAGQRAQLGPKRSAAQHGLVVRATVRPRYDAPATWWLFARRRTSTCQTPAKRWLCMRAQPRSVRKRLHCLCPEWLHRSHPDRPQRSHPGTAQPAARLSRAAAPRPRPPGDQQRGAAGGAAGRGPQPGPARAAVHGHAARAIRIVRRRHGAHRRARRAPRAAARQRGVPASRRAPGAGSRVCLDPLRAWAACLQMRRRRWPCGSELLRRCHLLPTAPLWPARRRTVTAAPGSAGAAVVELLPYNWEWRGISQVYANVTRSLGDVHHFAWRAGSPQWAVFGEGEERYAAWSAQECSSRCCAAPPSSPLLRDQRCQKLSADVRLLAMHRGRMVTTDAPEAPRAWPSHDAGRAWTPDGVRAPCKPSFEGAGR